MEVIVKTKDGVVHDLIDGKWVPEIIVPDHIQEKILRGINELREEERTCH